jgi:hypothetical protein
MKTAQNVDENTKSDVQSTKTAKIMDGNLKIQFPSMKSAKNVDENTTPKNHGRQPEVRTRRADMSGDMIRLGAL